jgi:hypothetical protein
VTLVLLIIFGLLVGVRVWRQRHGAPRRPRRSWMRLGRRSKRASKRTGQPLLPASLLKGADRTWVLFVNRHASGDLVDRLRAAQPDAEVTAVDCEQRPELAATFLIRRFPTVLIANRYGQVEARLVGNRAIGNAIGVRI